MFVDYNEIPIMYFFFNEQKIFFTILDINYEEKSITFENKSGETNWYSKYAYDITGATQNQVIYPSLDPSIFEIKYPDTDIKGKVSPL